MKTCGKVIVSTIINYKCGLDYLIITLLFAKFLIVQNCFTYGLCICSADKFVFLFIGLCYMGCRLRKAK